MNIIEKEKLIVIFRGVKKEQLDKLLLALYRGGVRVIEIAYNHSDPDTIVKTCDLIRTAKEIMHDKMMIGAGTVLSEKMVVEAHKAGAEFIFSPNVNVDVIKLTKELGLISIPGAMTPSECMTAYDAGADVIKMFPITLNEVDYLKNIMRPLSHIPFICVGGVSIEAIPAYMEAGAIGVGTGISILKPELLETENYNEIEKLARKHIEALNL